VPKAISVTSDHWRRMPMVSFDWHFLLVFSSYMSRWNIVKLQAIKFSRTIANQKQKIAGCPWSCVLRKSFALNRNKSNSCKKLYPK